MLERKQPFANLLLHPLLSELHYIHSFMFQIEQAHLQQ